MVGSHLHKMLTLLKRQLQQTNSSAAPCYRNLHFCISKSNCFPLMRQRKCCYSKDICPNIHMIFQQPFIMKSWLLQQQQLWSFSLAGSDYVPLVCHPPCNSPKATPCSTRGLCTSRFGRLEMITHDSGIRVIFTNEQKLGQIRNAIATDGQFRNVNATAGSSENVNA